MSVIAVYNLKGGVGKTATAVNLACLSAATGTPTLVWDLDPQGAAAWYLEGELSRADAKGLINGKSAINRLVQTTPYENLFLLPASFSYRYLDVLLKKAKPRKAALKRILAPFAERFPNIILDCPPSLSYLADSVFEAADQIVLPVIPTWLSMRALEQLRKHFRDQGLDEGKLLPFYSMVDRRRQLHAQLLEHRPVAMRGGLRAALPYASAVEKMGEFRAPVFAYLPPSDPVIQAYAALWQELTARS